MIILNQKLFCNVLVSQGNPRLPRVKGKIMPTRFLVGNVLYII